MKALICGISLVAAVFCGISSASELTDDEKADAQSVDEILVRGYRGSGYRVADTSSASLFDLALNETPFNIGVITERLIDELQIDNLQDAVLLNASITRSHTHSNNAVNLTIRGFALNADLNGYLVNGVPVSSFDAPPAHTSALERIEVLKGSAALYYGAGEPAGVINYVYKSPLEEARYSASVSVGSDDEYRAEIDATGSLGSDSLLYRFTLGWEDSRGFTDFDYSKDLAPTLQLQWNVSDLTRVRFIGEYIEHEGNPMSTNVFFVDGDWLEGPKSQYYGFSTDYETQESAGAQIHVDHSFSDKTRLKVQAGYKDGGREAGNSGYLAFLPFTTPGFADAENGLALRSAFDQKRESEVRYLATHLAHEFNTGDISHEFMVGVNYSKTSLTNIAYFNSIANVIPEVFVNPALLFTLPPSVNVFDPVTVEYDHLTDFYSPPFTQARWDYENYGLNLQDAIDIPSMNLHVLLGLRYGDFSTEPVLNIDDQGNRIPNIWNTAQDSAWIPRVGVVYDFNEQHSLYASYGESFKPPFTTATDLNGDPITETETGNQFELGYRGEFLDGNLSATVAIYELTKEDVIVPTGIPEVSEVAGEQRSRGLELDLVGRVSDGWDLYLSYAYTDTNNVDGGTTAANDGGRFVAVPLHKAVIWNTFELDWTGVPGLSLGYGLDYSSKYLMGAITDFSTLALGEVLAPEQGVVHNATISYTTRTDLGDLNLILGLYNLTDRFYVNNTSNALFATRGTPRSAVLTASLTF